MLVHTRSSLLLHAHRSVLAWHKFPFPLSSLIRWFEGACFTHSGPWRTLRLGDTLPSLQICLQDNRSQSMLLHGLPYPPLE